MRDIVRRRYQGVCIHTQVFATMEVAQESDTSEQIADEKFKRDILHPASLHFDTRRRAEIEFKRVGNLRCAA